MSNLATNTGKRYHLRTVVSVRAEENGVATTLECGHTSRAALDSPEQAERVAARSQAYIGKPTPCTQCLSRQIQEGKR